MSVSNLATALSVLFAVFLVALAGELIYVLWRHRSFRRRSSPIPTHHEIIETPNSSIADHIHAATSTKELQLYFFCLKPHSPPPPNYKDAGEKDDESSPEDHVVVDVLKLLDVKDKGEEEDKDEGESKKADVDFSNKSTTKTSSEVGLEEEGDTKTVFSTPCDSPMFFTPVGSPSRD
ncbi:hypothetical protein SSX86_019625 [Deinandra increscens subsp. villosa]|uniref:Uncharacterized protein n=1 Tax=Deinandra increscens subsp. villosa TaxID=3103831 RepID=A0AAP0D059_9ASTR